MALLKDIQSTPYSNYDDSYVQGWLAVQSKCNTGPLPTAAQPPVTNITTLPGVVTSNPSNSTCLSGNHYTVQPGDDVQTIAVAHNVATGTLKILNGIFPDGTNLLVGQDLYVNLSLQRLRQNLSSSIAACRENARRIWYSQEILVLP